MHSSNVGSKRDASGTGKAPVSTAKRSPSILVTDVRKNQIKAPFAGHKLEQLKNRKDRSQDRVSDLVKIMRRSSNSKYSNISVSSLTSNISDIPSSRQREAPKFVYNDSFGARKNPQKVPQYVKNLPSRTSKVTQKLVLIPENERNDETLTREKSTTDNIFQEINNRTKAEKLTKEQREHEYPRVTAYLIAEGFNLKLTSKFLAKYHMVLPRLYDEVLYIPYSLPLLPGENGYRVQSNTSLKMQRGIQLMEQFINKSEERDHHYEFYSGADHENNENSDQIDSLSHSPNPNDFDPSEPQFFVSSSPTESILEQEMRESINEDRSDSTDSTKSDILVKNIDDTKNTTNSLDKAIEISADNETSDLKKSLDDMKKNIKEENKEISNAESDKLRRSSLKPKNSHLPDLTKHAEMFILDYGVVVFWNFSEIHEKNILADLVFAKIQPGEFDDEDDEDDEDEEDEDDDEDEDNDFSIAVRSNANDLECQTASEYENDVANEEELSLIIKPVSEHDIETEEFHFEYNRDVPTPRIYNDMITLKSGDHLIKLTMSHAIAQSTKLSLFESKMSNVLNSISKLPKALALTGRLQNYTTKRLLTKTGRLFQLRSEVNLLSNVLDTPEYFWSIEPGLHPLYTAVRDYLEIEQRVEVINDRCKVFLDFFDILSDSLAERKMTKITKILIIAIGLSVIVSVLEIFVRYLIISRFATGV
jgi:uncharacterized Rmd1/YagE family protein